MAAQTEIAWCDPLTWGVPIRRKDGYIVVLNKAYPGTKDNKGHVLLHRLVVGASLGRALTSAEHVHHINGDKGDNRRENLQLTTNSEHRKHHESMIPTSVKRGRAKAVIAYSQRIKKPRLRVFCECGCGQTFTTPDSKGRTHHFINGHCNKGKTWKWSKCNG